MTQAATVAPSAKHDHAADLISRHFAVERGELLVGGVRVSEIASRYGTPAYLYDERALRRQWQALRDALPEKFSIFYSVKANPNQAILRFFVEAGCGLEIASSGELHQALKSGCPARRIFFAGPGKTEAELAAALDSGIGEIHVESLVEARRLADLSRQRGRVTPIALRVNPSAEVAGGGMRMGAKPVAFGIDEDQLDGVLDALDHETALDVVGLHVYVGTQILDHETLLAQYRAALDIARHISRRRGKPLATVDFGGGLGTPYFAHEQRLDLAALRNGLETLIDETKNDPALASAEFIVEPGRFLVAESGIYLTRVTDLKTSRGKKFAVLDGGMHHHLAASGNLGQTIKRNYPLAVLNKLDRPANETVELAGPLCTPLDVLARSAELPELAIGDLIGVFQSGAYGRAASPLGFLSRLAPPEILVRDGNCQLVRRRGTDDDYLRDQTESISN